MRPLAVRCTVLATAILLAAGITGGDQSYGSRGGRVGLRCTLCASGAPLLQTLGLRGVHSAGTPPPFAADTAERLESGGCAGGGGLCGGVGGCAGGGGLRGGYEPDVMSPCDVSVRNLRTTTSHNVQRFRGGLVFKAHRLSVSLNSRLESNKEEEKKYPYAPLSSSPHQQDWRSAPRVLRELVRGYLAHKKQPPPRTLQ